MLAALGGLVTGSFATVVAHRVPIGGSLVSPRSSCPSCAQPVAPRDNVPVLSWLLLGGRCRHCRARISWRYPATEALTAALFVLAVARVERSTDLVVFLPFLWVLVPLSFIDLERKILPNAIVLPAIPATVVLVAVAAALGPGWEAFLRALAGGVVAFGGFLAIALVQPRGMGMGDVKLSAMLGIGLGYLGWGRLFAGFMLAFLSGAVVSLGLVAARRAGRKSQVPFGPFLALGTAISVLYGEPIVRAWLSSGP